VFCAKSENPETTIVSTIAVAKSLNLFIFKVFWFGEKITRSFSIFKKQI
jgi:hypothetical protein